MRTIPISQLVSEYCDEERLRKIMCFMIYCNKPATHVEFIDAFSHKVFHCNLHKSENHMKIQKYKWV